MDVYLYNGNNPTYLRIPTLSYIILDMILRLTPPPLSVTGTFQTTAREPAITASYDTY